MSQEIVYTSSPQGLKLGSRGFCTVASTSGMASSLAERLESLSGYRHLYPPQDPQARLNPIAWSHLLLTVGGRRYHVLSRIADAGLDYSQRSNKLAHHVALETKELPQGGPAWCLAQDHFMLTAWNEPPRLLSSGRVPPRGEQPTSVCTAWQRVAGDAGWAGVLAQTAEAKRDAYLLFSPGMDLLPLLVEAQSLLPPARRWEVSFSTYVTRLPPGVECRWRCVVADSDEALAARRAPGATVIDLTQPLGPAPAGPLVAAARTGQITFPALPRPTEVAPLVGAQRKPLAGIDTTPDADLLSDGDYRLADDRTIPGPPPPVQLKMGPTAASSGRAGRLALLVGGVLGLLMLIGGGIAATKYIGRALASLPSKVTDSAPDPELEQHRATAQDAIKKWEAAVNAFTKETGATTLSAGVLQAIDEESQQATRQSEEIAQLNAAEQLKNLESKLSDYRQHVNQANELQKKEGLKAEDAKKFESVQTGLLNGKQTLQTALEPAKAVVEKLQNKCDELKQLHQHMDNQRKCAQELLAAQKGLLEQQKQLSTTSERGLDDLRGQLNSLTEQAAKDFADLESWSQKLAAQCDKLAELTKKLPAPPDGKLLPDSQDALDTYDSLKKDLAERQKKLPQPDPGEFLTKLQNDYVIDGEFPAFDPREIPGLKRHSGRLFAVPAEAIAGFSIAIQGENSELRIKPASDSKSWNVEKGPITLEEVIGTFAIRDEHLTWKWTRSVNPAMNNVVLKLSAGSKHRTIRLLTSNAQVKHPPITLAEHGEIRKTIQPEISFEFSKDVHLEILGAEFALAGYHASKSSAAIKDNELKLTLTFSRDSDKPAPPRFSLFLCFKRQANPDQWKLQAEPLKVLIVSTDPALNIIESKDRIYQPLSVKVLQVGLLATDSGKVRLRDRIDGLGRQIMKLSGELMEMEQAGNANKRNEAIANLRKKIADLEQDKVKRQDVSAQVFPDDLFEELEKDPQGFADRLTNSLKIHAQIVRKEKGKPPLTIAEFGEIDVSKPAQSKPMPAPEKGRHGK